MPAINQERLLRDLYALRQIGAYKTGVHRPTLSPEDVISRQWLVERLTEAGLDAHVDGIANVFGRSRARGRIILAGSHIESQNQAGWLDGALGVIYALEVARALREDPAMHAVGVDVIAFCDEEGHFGSYLGSRSFIGDVSEAEIDNARDRTHGHMMRHALKEAGYAGRPRFQFDPGRYVGYFEAHIEQGGSLEASNLKIGVVTAIVGLWDYRFKVIGHQNHAGTTTMAERRDAGLALVRLIAALDQEFKKAAGPHSVWTCGRMEFDPGAPSIIPGEARAMFQFRDSDPAILNRLEAALHAQVAIFNEAGPCSISVETIRQSTPAGTLSTSDRARSGNARAGARGADAVGRRPRCATPRARNAGGDAVRAEHQWHKPSLGRKYLRRGHRAGRPRLHRRDSRRADGPPIVLLST
jgi:beta-ureidopropionase / N-carbamoyl-L-amino-acid hydrolase